MLARLSSLHHRPLFVHHDSYVRPDEVLEVGALGLGQLGGEVVGSGQFVRLTLHVGLGRLVVLPHGDDHEGEQHGVGEAQDGVDEAGDVVLPLSTVWGHKALHHQQPRDRHEHGQEDRKDYVDRGC